MIFEWKKQFKSILLGLLIAGFFCAWAESAQADNRGPSISIVPHTFDLSLEPGEEKRDRIKVYNKGEVAIPFALKIVEFGAKDVTGEMVMLEKQDQQTPSDWIEFEKKDFIVDPGQKEVINFSVHIPDDAEPQGYYAMALFEADISTLYFNENRVQVIPNMGVLFMLKVEGGEESDDSLALLEYSVLDEHRLERAEKVANFLAQPFVSDDEQINVIKSEQPTFLVKVKNNDPYHKKITGNIKLSGVGWKLEDELEAQPVTILPGMTRELVVKGVAEENEQDESQGLIKEAPKRVGSFGLMQADLKIEGEEGVKKEERQLIIVFSWKMVALFLLAITCIVVPVWIVRRKRRKVKPKPKFKKHALGAEKVDKKSEGKMANEIEIKTGGSENVQSEKIKDFWKEFDDVPPGEMEKSPKGGSSSGRKKAIKKTAKKIVRKKIISTKKAGVVKKIRKRKTAKKNTIARKKPAKKTTLKKKIARKKPTRKKAVPKRAKTTKRKTVKKKTTPKKKSTRKKAVRKRKKKLTGPKKAETSRKKKMKRK